MEWMKNERRLPESRCGIVAIGKYGRNDWRRKTGTEESSQYVVETTGKVLDK